MTGVGETGNRSAADETGCAWDQDGLPSGQSAGEAGYRRAMQSREPLGCREVAHSADANTNGGYRREDAPGAVIRRLERAGPGCPFDQDRQQENKDRAVVKHQQSVIDPFARRKFPAHVLFDKIHQRDDDFHDQDRDDQHRPDAVDFQPAERQEQQRIKRVAHAIELKLTPLRRAPGQPLGHFVMIERVERSHRDLNGDQGPEIRRGHGVASLKTAD